VLGLKKADQKFVNFDKLREIQQEKEENPASFLSKLTEALGHHTKFDPETQDGTIILMTHLISQSSPDIRRKLERLENGPQTPQTEILNLVFKVYNYKKNNKGLIRRGKIRLNSRCWHKSFNRGLQPLTPKARKNPEHLPAHVFSVALRDTGPMHVLNLATHRGHVLNENRRVTG
jgi:hypothetical protein